MEVLHGDGKPGALEFAPAYFGGAGYVKPIYDRTLLEAPPQPMQAWERSAKRTVDVLVSLAVLLAGLPLWIALGIAVKLTSPGPTIYRQLRVGRHGRPFMMYKFRTMQDRAEDETGPVWAREDDPRYTRLGRWLRKWRLDEVPQCWNVLTGHMSLVGPRPERPFFVEQLSAEIPLYLRRHSVKPGITGWAQVKWKYDSCVEDVRQKVAYDLFYIQNMSLRMDFQILLGTLRMTLSGRGQ